MENQNKDAASNEATEEKSVQTKQEHIKERLKDLGVSEESERPKKSWFSQYGSYVMVAVAITLVTIYWLENKNQDNNPVAQVAQKESSGQQNQNTNLHQPNQMMSSNNQGAPWMQKNAANHRMMQQKAWEQQKIQHEAWRKQMRDQQDKNRQAWEQYIKQQQAMYHRGMPANGAEQGNMQQQNPNQNQSPQFAGSYPPPYWNNSQRNQWQQNPHSMPGYNQAPPNYPAPQQYQQPYPNPYYYNGR